jgi:hypothetical protein
MDRYWAYVGTPLFFIVVLFGLFVLFTLNPGQVAASAAVQRTLEEKQRLGKKD